MDAAPLLDRVVDDEGIAAGLDEAEAMLLIHSLSDRVRSIAQVTNDPATARRQVDDLCRQARKIADQVSALPPGVSREDQLRQLLATWGR